MDNVITSLFSNIKQKSTNPFLGTLVLVWTYRNWELLYTLFKSEPNLTISAKINMLEPYFNAGAFIVNILISMGLAILLLVLTYFLLNVSRFITNIYEEKVTPFVNEIVSESSVVTREKYNKLKEQCDKYFDNYEAEKKRRIEISEERDRAEKKLSDHLSLKKAPTPPEESIIKDDNYLPKMTSDLKKFLERFSKPQINEFIIESKMKEKIFSDNEVLKYLALVDAIEIKTQLSDGLVSFIWTTKGKDMIKNFTTFIA